MGNASYNATFRTMDSDAAGQGNPVDALVLRELGRNLNLLNRDLVQPCCSLGYEVAEPSTEAIASRHSRRVNAPAGAWTSLVSPTWVRLPPGFEDVQIDVRADLTNGQSAYLQAYSNRKPFDPTLRGGDTGVYTLSGSGSAATYPTTEGDWTVPVRGNPSGYTMIGVAVYTTGGTLVDRSLVSSATDLRLQTYSGGFGTVTRETNAERDTWVRIEGLEDVVRAWQYENDGTAYVELTALGSTGSGEYPFPAATGTPVGDAFYIGMHRPFPGVQVVMETQGNTVQTVTWEYWDGSAWSALTFLSDGQEVDDFDEATGATYYNVWDLPTDWEATTRSNSEELFYVRARISAFTSSTARAEVKTVKALGPTKMPFSRVGTAGLRTTGDGDTLYELWHQAPRFREYSDPDEEVALVVRATELDLHAVLIDPVAMPLRVG